MDFREEFDSVSVSCEMRPMRIDDLPREAANTVAIYRRLDLISVGQRQSTISHVDR